MRLKIGLLIALAWASTPAAAITFNGDWALSGEALGAGSGLDVRFSHERGDLAVDLDDGRSARIALFRIWSDETDVGRDDLLPRGLVASFRLGSAAGTIAGSVVGHRSALVEWGDLSWEEPLKLEMPDGILSIRLGRAGFSHGLLGLSSGRRYGADVFARIGYTRGVATPVPVPPALSLAAAASLILLSFGRRRR